MTCNRTSVYYKSNYGQNSTEWMETFVKPQSREFVAQDKNSMERKQAVSRITMLGADAGEK